MRDSESEQNYPVRPPRQHYGHTGNGRPHSFDEEDEAALDAPAEDAYAQEEPLYEHEENLAPPLPSGGIQKALIIGAIAGILCAIQSIAITLFNAPTYAAYDAATQQTIKQSLAFTIFGYAILTFFISLLIYLIAGFITGKVAIQRRRGFLAGFVAGLLTYATSFITRYIPNYPGNQHTGAGLTDIGTTLTGLIIILIFFLVWGLIGGLISLLGTWLATRRHPYYVEY